MLDINEQLEKYKAAAKQKRELAEIFRQPSQQIYRDTLNTNAEELESIVAWLEELLKLRKKKSSGKKNLVDQ